MFNLDIKLKEDYYITVPKDTKVEKEQFAFYVFAETSSLSYFHEINKNISEDRLVILDDIISNIQQKPFFLNNKEVYFQYILPRVFRKFNLYIYDNESFRIVMLPNNINNIEQILYGYNEINDLFYFVKKSLKSFFCFKSLKYIEINKSKEFDNNSILLIPHNGIFNGFDFTLQRLAKYFKTKGMKVKLLIQDRKIENFCDDFDEVYTAENLVEFIEYLQTITFKEVLYRGWMLTYSFGGFLSYLFKDHALINIKDWASFDKSFYSFLYGEKFTHDFDAMEYIFKSDSKVISHYSNEQAKIWSKKYNVNQNKFIFLPELCNQEKFVVIQKEYKKPKLVIAGTIHSTSMPEEFSSSKGLFEVMKKLTKNDIEVHYVYPETFYESILNEKNAYNDVLYENTFNQNFFLHKGRNMEPSVLNDFNFGVFVLKYTTMYKDLNEYAIPSKFAFYLEAGLPILINEKMKGISNLVKEFSLGIVFSDNNIEILINKLKCLTQIEYDSYVNNVLEFRKQFSYSNIKSIVDFELKR